MTFIPVHEAHAIDKVAVAVVLSVAVETSDWFPVVERALRLGRELEFAPPQERVVFNVTAVNPQPGVPPSVSTQVFPAGVGFKRNTDSGALLAEFMVMRHEVRVESYAYVRWAGFKELVANILSPILSAFPEGVEVTQVKLEYWDRFVSQDGSANWTDVVRLDSRLPAWPSATLSNWHSHLGWFEETESGRTLVNVNVDTLNENLSGEPEVPTVRVYTLAATAAPRSLQNVIKCLDNDLEELHSLSKRVIADVVSSAMVERISLFPKD